MRLEDLSYLFPVPSVVPLNTDIYLQSSLNVRLHWIN